MRLAHPLAAPSLALRFLLELTALAGLGYWGFATGGGSVARIALALGAPLVAALAWATFGSPKAPLRVTGAAHLLLELAFFGSAALALAAAGQSALAALFALVVAGNIVLLHPLGHP